MSAIVSHSGGMNEGTKTHRITVRVSRETAQALRVAARAEGRALSDYVRLVIVDRLAIKRRAAR